MRRAAIAILTAILVLGVPSVVQAHPLGNFTINHLTQVRISGERVDLRYIVDEAEIPTFQERQLPAGQRLARVRAQIARGLHLSVDGRPVTVAQQPGATLRLLPGQGGLQTTRVEIPLRAAIPQRGQLVLSDQTFPARLGWKAIVAQPGRGSDVRSSVPSSDITDGLRRYPTAAIASPSDQRVATFSVHPGNGALVAPGPGGGEVTTRSGQSSAGDGFAAVFSDAASGKGVLLLLLLASFGWGALHALSPGHGKGMVAAYLVGSRGTSRDAVALSLVVTVTHTIGVMALGLVTLLLAQYVLPEDLYPWLNLVSGLLVVIIGSAVLWTRVQRARGLRPALLSSRHADDQTHGHDHDHDATHSHDHAHDHHDHTHGHDHTHDHDHAHDHHDHTHGHDDDAHLHAGHGHARAGHAHGGGHHHDHLPRDVTWRGILTMGAAAGLLPCPSALVVLLGAISQHQIGLGLLLIVVFSIGLASTLAVLGLAVVHAGRLTTKLHVPGAVTRALPTASALVIVGLGLMLTTRAVPALLS
jgi:ABC-type nickel/cobalt efflux system permease component RcnA